MGLDSGYWIRKRVIVTGGTGFLGSFVVERLWRAGCASIVAPRRRTHDLRDPRAVRKLLADTRANVVIHLAARVGGIGANQKYPAEFFYDNLMMSAQLL